MNLLVVRVVFVLAIFTVGAAAPLARLAGGVHPLSLGFWRVGIVGAMMLLWSGMPRLSPKDWGLTSIAALCLAGHFWAWFASLQETTILRSTVLVCLNPVWVGLWEWIETRRFNRMFWLGTGLAILGATVMSFGGQDINGAQSLVGDGLALLAGVLGSIYLLLSQSVRQRVEIAPYTALLCLITAMFLWGVSMTQQVSVVDDWTLAPMVILAMALGPQLFGHAGLTWTVKYLSAGTIALGLLFEPVGAAILGWWWFAEVPTGWELIGSVIVLCGLGVGLEIGQSPMGE